MRRRLIAALAVLACAVVIAGVVVGGGGDGPGRLPATTAPQRALDPGADVALVRRAAVRASRARYAERRRRAAARMAEVRRLRRSRTVRGALRRAWLARAIDKRTHDGYRRSWWLANRDAGRLAGTRRAELGAVVAIVARLGHERRLTASRLEPVFLTLRRNREFWTRDALPRPGDRVSFRRDPVVFQYYSGRGLQLMPLASFGKANALSRACLERTRDTCRPAALGTLLARMVSLGANRDGFLGWEYYFSFGTGAPPWISGMTQATGVQALMRGRRVLGDRRLAVAARRALGAFETPPPAGVSVPSGGGHGRRYAMYSFNPRLRILNGELQAVIGLRDTATLSGSRRARRLYARAERVARRSVAAYDTGAWSLYSWGGAESTLSYHVLVGDFLEGLCRRTGRSAYCATGQRFARYVREPPRVRVSRLRRVRTRRATRITFTLSKISDVSLTVSDRRGVHLRRTMALPRGRHRVRWVPPRSGRHRLRIVAVGPAGTRAVVQRIVRSRPVPRPCRRTPSGRDRSKRRADTRAKTSGRARARCRRGGARPRTGAALRPAR